MDETTRLLAWYIFHELDALSHPDMEDVQRILERYGEKGADRVLLELRISWPNDGTNDEFWCEFPEMRKLKLKLYVWEDVLSDHTSGLAVALASSPDEAKKFLIKAGLDEGNFDGTKLDHQEPKEYDVPYAIYVFGGS